MNATTKYGRRKTSRTSVPPAAGATLPTMTGWNELCCGSPRNLGSTRSTLKVLPRIEPRKGSFGALNENRSRETSLASRASISSGGASASRVTRSKGKRRTARP
jgi:hypothetical protein